MTPFEFIDKALPIIRSWRRTGAISSRSYEQWERDIHELSLRNLWGQPSKERTCYEKDGKHYLRSYNSHMRTPDMEWYDAYNLWELDGDKLTYLGGHHR